MSIQTELSRIVNAKAAIKSAIEGKGVTVPDATLLDGMAPLIESIEAGGGLPGFCTGTITGTGESGIITIENAFPAGKAPRVIFIYEERAALYDNISGGVYYPKLVALRNSEEDTSLSTKSSSFYMLFNYTYKSGTSNNVKAIYSEVSRVLNGVTTGFDGKNAYNIVKGNLLTGSLLTYSESTYGIRAGKTYRWVTILEGVI